MISKEPIKCTKIIPCDTEFTGEAFEFDAPINSKFLNISDDCKVVWVTIDSDTNPFDIRRYKIFTIMNDFLIETKFLKKCKFIKTLITKHLTYHLFAEEKLC